VGRPLRSKCQNTPSPDIGDLGVEKEGGTDNLRTTDDLRVPARALSCCWRCAGGIDSSSCSVRLHLCCIFEFSLILEQCLALVKSVYVQVRPCSVSD
jgi:hypothetical protein